MQYSTFTKALSISLLLSCATHINGMTRKDKRNQANKAGWQNQQQKPAAPAVQPSPAPVVAAEAARPSSASPEVPASVAAAALTQEAFAQEEPVTALIQAAPVASSTSVEALEAAASNNNSNNDLAPAKASVKTLLGKELHDLYSTDERPLVGKSLIWGTVDATQPYKDEGKLIAGLEKNDSNYLKDVQAQQDLNRTLNQICAGIIQKIKEQSTLDKESGNRTFNVDQIEAILNSQYPRILSLQKILGLCDARIKAKHEPLLHPTESAKELAQRCSAAILQLQLERKRIRSEEENNRIRAVKAGQKLAYAMRLMNDKGVISDDEYTDAFIFDATSGE